MNVLALLACIALCSCALGALGLARVRKPRRGLKSIERACLLDPLSIPPRDAPPVPIATATAPAVLSALVAALAGLISPILAPLTRVEQATAAGAADPADPDAHAQPQPPLAILAFLRDQPLARAALRLSGLSLLMANQHQRAAPAVVAVAAPSAAATNANDALRRSGSGAAETDAPAAAAKSAATRAPQPAADSDADADCSDMDMDQDDDDDENDDFGDAASISDDDKSDDEQFEDPRAEDERDAQRAFFDGLQFYSVLTQVGAATVRSVVQQALASAAQERVRAQQRASIAAIEQRYPDLLCLTAPAGRADLASALLAVTAAAAAMQQPHAARALQPCGSMERRLSTKRPESLALAAEDGMEPARRTPLTSPSAASVAGGAAGPIEPSYLQAA